MMTDVFFLLFPNSPMQTFMLLLYFVLVILQKGRYTSYRRLSMLVSSKKKNIHTENLNNNYQSILTLKKLLNGKSV